MVQEQRLKGTVEQLVGIIRDIQLRRETGMLMARRGTGALAEEGSISFVNGQVKEAKASRRSGAPALNYLSTWRKCSYSFMPPIVASPAKPTPAPQPQEAKLPATPLAIPASRAPILQSIGKHSLTRAHRHVFLLVDGKRSTGDLERVTGRRAQELYQLLDDLERAGLIALFAPQTYRRTVLA